MSPRNFPDRDRDRGQAAVEFALVLPLVVVLLLLVVQVTVVLVERLRLAHTTRDAVRAASVSDEPARAARLAVDRNLPTATVETRIVDHLVTVDLEIVVATDLALVGALLPDVTLRDRLVMVHEPVG